MSRLLHSLEPRRHDQMIHFALSLLCREASGREAIPSACEIDSQSVKSVDKGGLFIDPPGYDAGKTIKGKKRHVLVDTVGVLLHAVVHPADIQDRDGGVLLLSTLFGMYPFLAEAVCRCRLYKDRSSLTAASGVRRASQRHP